MSEDSPQFVLKLARHDRQADDYHIILLPPLLCSACLLKCTAEVQ